MGSGDGEVPAVSLEQRVQAAMPDGKTKLLLLLTPQKWAPVPPGVQTQIHHCVKW